MITSCGTEPTPQRIFYADASYLGISSGAEVWELFQTAVPLETNAYKSDLSGSPELGVATLGAINEDTSYRVNLTIKNFKDVRDTLDVEDGNIIIRVRLIANDKTIIDEYAKAGSIAINDVDTMGGKHHIFGEFTAELDPRTQTPEPRIVKGFFDCRFSEWR
jgi:hypothetical protein